MRPTKMTSPSESNKGPKEFDGQANPAPLVTLYEHCNHWARRRPMAAAIIGIVLTAIALLILILGILWIGVN